MSFELTLAKAQELIQAAIEDRGEEYVYPKAETGTCTYVDVSYQGELSDERVLSMGCIVGHAFISALDLDMEEIAEEYVNDEGAASFTSWLVQRKCLTEVNVDALDYIERVQRSQDAGRPWGEANEMAKQGLIYSKAYEEYIGY